ncbi:hypothetical protein E4U09_000794 [Claviceps aff. purpurea]|uniref:Uncharacterized protein n=1 Tax=Claviceps aff. purpurea TaxID=1967640 RepID=A0A9P7QN69_9HYPO|nr:hypothetical protein E4U09_000794 [Claviceps aff. purpurea]
MGLRTASFDHLVDLVRKFPEKQLGVSEESQANFQVNPNAGSRTQVNRDETRGKGHYNWSNS